MISYILEQRYFPYITSIDRYMRNVCIVSFAYYTSLRWKNFFHNFNCFNFWML